MNETIDELIKERTVLENRLGEIRRELRRYYIQQRLDKLGVKAGHYIWVDGERWRLGTMFELELKNNNLNCGDLVWLYGYKITKDGKDGKRLTCIYSSNIESL